MLFAEISHLDSQKKMYQLQADEKFLQAAGLKKQAVEPESENTRVEEENPYITLKEQIGDINVYQYTPEAIALQEPERISPDPDDTSKEEHVDEVLSGSFDILEHSPYSFENPIPYDIPLPEGLIYRIQIGAFSKPIAQDAFSGIFPVSAEKDPESGITKYFAGIFNSSVSATRALEQIKNYGFPDSFIVPFLNGEKISIQRAKEIEYSQIKFQ